MRHAVYPLDHSPKSSLKAAPFPCDVEDILQTLAAIRSVFYRPLYHWPLNLHYSCFAAAAAAAACDAVAAVVLEAFVGIPLNEQRAHTMDTRQAKIGKISPLQECGRWGAHAVDSPQAKITKRTLFQGRIDCSPSFTSHPRLDTVHLAPGTSLGLSFAVRASVSPADRPPHRVHFRMPREVEIVNR